MKSTFKKYAMLALSVIGLYSVAASTYRAVAREGEIFEAVASVEYSRPDPVLGGFSNRRLILAAPKDEGIAELQVFNVPLSDIQIHKGDTFAVKFGKPRVLERASLLSGR